MNPWQTPRWMERALCRETGEPDAFFTDGGGGWMLDAKAVCGHCEVRAECLQYALDNDERFGVWGGLSERQRERMRRERAS